MLFRLVKSLSSRATERALALVERENIAPYFESIAHSQIALYHFCRKPYRTICHNNPIFKDPTGTVRNDVNGEVEALRLYEEIIHHHPKWKSEQVDALLVERIYTPERVKNLSAIFNEVKNSALQFVAHWPGNGLKQSELRIVANQIFKLTLEVPPPASLYSDEPDLFTKNDVLFEHMPSGRLVLRVGGAYFFTARSRFNRIFTMAHEIAHAIDPCETLPNGKPLRDQISLYTDLADCFGAHQWVHKPNRAWCAGADQLSEAFADWFAAGLTALALRTVTQYYSKEDLLHAGANAVRDLCDEGDDSDFEYKFHPRPEVRIRDIFFGHPWLRRVMGCAPSSAHYCGLEVLHESIH